jgi:hypothetical protein
MPPSLRETALKTCEWNHTTLDDVIADLKSMRMIACGAIHERGTTGDAAVTNCRFREHNLSCLHPKTASQGFDRVKDSVMVRLHRYLRLLAEMYANTHDESLRIAMEFPHPNQSIREIAESHPLFFHMKATEHRSYATDFRANHLHFTLPVLDAYAAIENDQLLHGKEVKRYRDKILAVFLQIQLRS